MKASGNVFEALHQIATEKGITREQLEEIVKAAIFSAYKKQFGENETLKVVFNREKNSISIITRKMVVQKMPQTDKDKSEQVTYDEAVKIYPDVDYGDEVDIEEDPFSIFGMIATQTAKQVIIQRIKEAEKNIIYNNFKEKEGELINGFMQRRSRNTIFVDIGQGGVEGILPRGEQSPREHYKQGDRIKSLVYKVEDKPKGPNIILSRVQPLFVERLFEMEIPEVYDGVVKIEKIVREAGMRTKVAVYSNDRDVDCVGACVGMKGTRIQSIVRELEGEKIDIIEYSDDPREMAENALTPATIKDIVKTVDGDYIAVVEEEQYHAAVGKIGHNVRLASQLCGFEITVKREEEYREMLGSEDSKLLLDQLFSEVPEDETPLDALGLEEKEINLLEKGGIFSVEELVEKDVDDLKEIDGIGEKTAEKIFQIVEEMVDFDEGEDDEDYEEEEE